MNLWELWKLIKADLERARNTLPPEAESNLLQYREFIDYNELELACDMLEYYADDHPVTRDFWLALGDAAEKMELSERVTRFRRRAEIG